MQVLAMRIVDAWAIEWKPMQHNHGNASATHTLAKSGFKKDELNIAFTLFTAKRLYSSPTTASVIGPIVPACP